MTDDKGKFLSTTKLANASEVKPKDLFDKLEKAGFIVRDTNNKWTITDEGKNAGGCIKKSSRTGEYVAWKEDFDVKSLMEGKAPVTNTNKFNGKRISATVIGKEFGLSATRINQIIDELGWMNKHLKGWKLTKQGKHNGGFQFEDGKTGIPYVLWDESIIKNKHFTNSVNDTIGTNAEKKSTDNSLNSFRNKFEAKHRAADGHFVRSKAEMLIDNWLYMAGIVHAYERKLPIEEEVYTDFYLPIGKVYIEFWGLEECDQKYADRKKIKQDIYKRYEFNLIELTDKEVLNLDDVLPKMLLKFGITTY